MPSTIQIELDALCLLLLCAIVHQSRKNVNQQMNRVLFRTTAYGIIVQLILDILWVLVEGRAFPGAILANRVINALYLGAGVCLGCIWYLYVLETLECRVGRRLRALVLLPGVAFTALNLISIRTGWIFTVSSDNIYSHGRLFWLQTIAAYGMIVISFAHITIYLFRYRHRSGRVPHHEVRKLFQFYVISVVGAVVSLFDTGMPGTWTSASVSIVLIYLNDQNREILSGMITAMAADYKSIYYADLDKDECICVRSAEKPNGVNQKGRAQSFREVCASYAERCVAEADREAFLRFVEPENIRAGLAREAMLSHRFLSRKNGVEQYELLRIAGVRTIEDREDHIVHAIGAGFSDVDRETRRAMEQKHALTAALARAEEANAAKAAFLNSMSHEIRTPMNAIIGLDNIALRDPSLSEATRRDLKKIGVSARHLLSLINDILDMSRIESGRMVLKTEEFSFWEMFEQIGTIIRGKCEDKRLTFESRIVGDTDEYFVGDALRLRQILINILGNAVKFTDPPGTVIFTVEQTGDAADSRMLCFTVRDTGIGMDRSFLPKLFEPFAQEDDTITNRYGGSGLGLAITKNMVDLMRGRIKVESVKGRGSTFTVEIPLQRAHHAVASDELPPLEPTASVAGAHLLIVEDIELNAEVLADLLEMEGVTSEWAENGKRAVELFAQSEAGHFDGILMDMRMPVMDGLTATRELRKLDRPDAARIPIIALTANAFEEDVNQCLSAGMDAHLAKPVDIEKLIVLLGRFLTERRPGQEP